MRTQPILRTTFLLAFGLLSACVAGSGAPNSAGKDAAGVPPGYQLIWADEFDVDGLPDNDKWTYDILRNPFGWYNKELQYYALARRENSRVENGKLIIEARAESAEQFSDSKAVAQEYTSARLITRGKASWTYGYFEVRAKISCGQGIWPAIWMLGEAANRGWPLNGEIDMMEHINNEDRVHFSIHTQAHNHMMHTQVTAQRNVAVCDGEFHDYQLMWTENEIRLGMDGRYYLRYRNEGAGVEQWPFESPQYFILNIAVGGQWPGKPDDSTVFPQRMEVDYVRVYQLSK